MSWIYETTGEPVGCVSGPFIYALDGTGRESLSRGATFARPAMWRFVINLDESVLRDWAARPAILAYNSPATPRNERPKHSSADRPRMNGVPGDSTHAYNFTCSVPIGSTAPSPG